MPKPITACVACLAGLTLSPRPLPAQELPSIAQIRRAVEDRWQQTDDGEVLVGRLTFQRRRFGQDAPDVWLPNNAISAWCAWIGDEHWSQEHYCSLWRRAGEIAEVEHREFVHQTFEQRASSIVLRAGDPGRATTVVENTIVEPNFFNAWLRRSIGVNSPEALFNRGFLADGVAMRVDEDQGHPCVVLTVGDSSLFLASDMDYAPLRWQRRSAMPDGKVRTSDERWLGYEEAHGLWVGRGVASVSYEYDPAVQADPTPADAILVQLTHVLSVNIGPRDEKPDIWFGIPLLVGGLYANRLTGLPAETTSFGYGMPALRRIAFEEPQPFGFDVPELLLFPRYAFPPKPRDPRIPADHPVDINEEAFVVP